MKPQFEKIPYTDGMSFACVSYHDKDCSNPYHLHPEYELTHFVHGRGHWMVGDSMGELRPGFLALLGSHLPHMYKMGSFLRGEIISQAEARVVQFREDCLGKDFFDLPENRRLKKLLAHARRGLVFSGASSVRLRETLARLIELPPERRLLPFLELLEAAADSSGSRCLASMDYQSTLQPDEAARINRVVDFLAENLASEIYLGDAARLIGLSNAAFSRFFRNTVKKTFSRFLNEMRISRACHRLAESDDTVTEIAFSCGFNNLSNFNRRFLEFRKETPTEFRTRLEKLVVFEEKEAGSRFQPS